MLTSLFTSSSSKSWRALRLAPRAVLVLLRPIQMKNRKSSTLRDSHWENYRSLLSVHRVPKLTLNGLLKLSLTWCSPMCNLRHSLSSLSMVQSRLSRAHLRTILNLRSTKLLTKTTQTKKLSSLTLTSLLIRSEASLKLTRKPCPSSKRLHFTTKSWQLSIPTGLTRL